MIIYFFLISLYLSDLDLNYHLNYISYLTIQHESMSNTRSKSAESAPVKKTLKKKSATKEISVEKKEKVVKTETAPDFGD